MTVTPEGAVATPGGGPAPRWSPRRLGHHRYRWWALALVVCLVVAFVALGPEGFAGAARRSDTALNIMIVAFGLALVAVWGLVHTLVTAIARRVRDDVRVHGVGQPVALEDVPGPPPGVEATVDHRPDAATLTGEPDKKGAWRGSLHAGGVRWSVRARARELTARDGDEVVARAARRGRVGSSGRDWEIGVEGLRFALRVHRRCPAPRRTLIDDRGEAWLVRLGRPSAGAAVRASGRVPDELSPAAATFLVWAVAQIERNVRSAVDLDRSGGGDSGDGVWAWDGGSTGFDGGGSGGGSGGGGGGDGGWSSW